MLISEGIDVLILVLMEDTLGDQVVVRNEGPFVS